MKRLDQWLVELGLAPTRSKAQQLIRAQEVEIRHNGRWQLIITPAHKAAHVKLEDVRVTPQSQTLKYVSRGGLKLAAALKHLALDVNGWRCMDVGQSTGGFTDCLLQHGASAVLGVDVGHGQLHSKVAGDPRVMALEGLNARDLEKDIRVAQWLKEQNLDLVVVDASFISLCLLIPVLAQVMPDGSRLLALVKPQFEVGAQALGKAGVVLDAALFDQVESRVLIALRKYGFKEQDYFICALKGQDGNQEFFVYALRNR